MTIAIIVIIILVFIIALLTVYNMSIHRRIQDFKNLHQKVNNLNIIQDFINIAGNDSTVDEKIAQINNVIIEKYKIRHSTIVVFDGTEYAIKATNVDKKHWDVLVTLQELDIFKDSITTTNPKYITVNNEQERLPYQKQEFGRAKSAIFFPLYIDNVYIGFWLVESNIPHDFDNIDITIYESARENIINVMKAVDYQKILESIVRKDLFTGLNSAEYLYGEGKKIIDKHTQSAICMLRISNIEEINKISRELGNKVITEVSKKIQKSIADTYIFVRYMGPKFVIAFCGINEESATDFVSELKENVEKLEISLEPQNYTTEKINKTSKEKEKRRKETIVVTPTLNFVVSTYYKGTGIEKVLKNLETSIDNTEFDTENIDNL